MPVIQNGLNTQFTLIETDWKLPICDHGMLHYCSNNLLYDSKRCNYRDHVQRAQVSGHSYLCRMFACTATSLTIVRLHPSASVRFLLLAGIARLHDALSLCQNHDTQSLLPSQACEQSRGVGVLLVACTPFLLHARPLCLHQLCERFSRLPWEATRRASGVGEGVRRCGCL